MQESYETFPISNSSNSPNQTRIWWNPEEMVEDFNFDEFGTPLIPDRT